MWRRFWFYWSCLMLGANLGCAIGYYVVLALDGPSYGHALILPLNLGCTIWYGWQVREQWRERRSIRAWQREWKLRDARIKAALERLERR